MGELEDKILGAMDIIASEMVQRAGYDKTIQAKILSCEDPTIGKYKCSYQNSTFYAYSDNVNNTYSKGSLVYITIPNNDMSKDKIIKGTTNRLGINYISTAPEENYYDIIGQNCVLSNETYYLDTNNKNYNCKIYQYQEGEENNYFINFIKQFENYIQQSSALLIAANIKTNIDSKKQYRGHYGISYTLKFKDNNSSNEISRVYILDENSMVGNPYRMSHKTRQYKLFDIDGSNFIRIESIQIFNRDFPNAENEKTDDFLTSGDIEISDLEFFGAAKMTEDEINGVGISFYTPQGTFFTGPDDSKKTITAQIKVKGRIATSLDNIPFYWGINNVKISANSAYYNKYLGRGWQCLNEKNIIQCNENEPDIVEWVPGSDTYIIKYNQVTARDNYLKVAVIYDNNIVTKEINIRNLNNDIETITIESDGGTEFYYDMGHPNLICKINNEDKQDDYAYYWSYQSSTGVFEDLTGEDPNYEKQRQYEKDLEISTELIKKITQEETILENAKYIDIQNDSRLKDEIDELKENIQTLEQDKINIKQNIQEKEEIINNSEKTDEEIQQAKEDLINQINQLTNKTKEIQNKEKELEEKEKKMNWNIHQWQEYMASYNFIQRVYKNKIYDVQICKITSFGTFKCSVFKITENNEEVYIGTAAITLYNKLENEGTYSLIINNGTVVYQYDEMGNAPTTFQGSLAPQQIKTLSFTLYNNLGQAIESTDILKDPQCEVIWGVPLKNTLLKLKTYNSSSSQQENEYEENNYHYYKNLEFLMYDIASKYSINKTNNQITLTINYKGTPFTAKTNFTFVKQGDPGTNGTDYIVKILPNTEMPNPPLIPIVTKAFNNNDSFFTLNYNYQNTSSKNANGLHHNNQGSLQLLKAQLWNNGEQITSINNNDVKWEVLLNPDNKNQIGNNSYEECQSSFVVSPSGSFKYYADRQSSQPFDIIKCTIQYDNKFYYGTLPIVTIQIDDGDNYQISLKENSGFYYVLYTTDGVNPQYDKTNPFEIICKQKINGEWIDISTTEAEDENNNYKIEYEVSVLPAYKQLLQNKQNEELKRNQFNLIPSKNFDGYNANIAVVFTLFQTDKAGTKKQIGKVHIPIHFLLNKYGLAHLNDWDGNSIKIDDAGGYILSPQMGAGSKNPSNNTFTGVLMGEVKQAGKDINETGLFGYASGDRTFFLDSQSGGALFGRNNGGRIIISPVSEKAILVSNNYWRQNSNAKGFPIDINKASDSGAGMLIDLTTPEIKFGSGHFSVNSSGNITAKGGGTIAGWTIGDEELQGGQIHLNKNGKIYSNTHNALNNTGTGFYLSSEGLSIGSKVKINNDGVAYFGLGAVDNQNSNHWTINSDTSKSYISYGGNTKWTSATNDNGTQAKVYIGTDGISIGSRFSISPQGELIANSGKIGGWEISNSTLTGGTNSDDKPIITLNSNGSMQGPNWSISSSGVATFSNFGGHVGQGLHFSGNGFNLGGSSGSGGGYGGSGISPNIGSLGGAGLGAGTLGGAIYTASKAEFDKLYATEAEFNRLKTSIANIDYANIWQKMKYQGGFVRWHEVLSNVRIEINFDKKSYSVGYSKIRALCSPYGPY